MCDGREEDRKERGDWWEKEEEEEKKREMEEERWGIEMDGGLGGGRGGGGGDGEIPGDGWETRPPLISPVGTSGVRLEERRTQGSVHQEEGMLVCHNDRQTQTQTVKRAHTQPL